MSLKAFAARIFAASVHRRNRRWIQHPIQAQRKLFQHIIRQGASTQFGRDHQFDTIRNPEDFARQVPVRDYEDLKPYVNQILEGQANVLWPGRPLYLAKTSGTTSGAKYIPITDVSIKAQVGASRDAILNYIHRTGRSSFVDGKMIFLQGSPELQEKNGMKIGRLSGISAHYVPGYLQRNRLPSWETNCMEDWEAKVDKIVAETLPENMTVIAGIPSWVQMYFEKIQDQTGKAVGEVFPNLELFIYGGVNFEPYRARFESLLGRKVASIELFPASEGFFAYQDQDQEPGMLLLTDAGIFYEFIEADKFYDENPRRLTLEQVQMGVNYAMIISTDAGLWAYNLGDTIAFTSLKPYRVIVTGRIKHFISAFGEHVIAKEVETALQEGLKAVAADVNEFTVAPVISPKDGELPFHEWLIEFESVPQKLEEMARVIDRSMQAQNSYYADLLEGNILQPLKITCIAPGGFRNFMKLQGKLGGQHKVQRLSNDRKVAEGLAPYRISP
ncbi:GH3 auxin-responsive promoter [Robiginitalea myxolifaciens]|uniref:GH3 auxin-responsive promoter n=1 Tax=Robiginitalea myxolifaciens TaxID=400055 RepID=A0A1I6G363_9FLAO|nr:GH3 auxin-responsive promoter family protein [Robiginitalea myxolifaciens]SFR36487.1 GH3 auxin-responsive promoter [Robiginitalea myxolifaciens]